MLSFNTSKANLKDFLINQIVVGLKRKSITRCSDYAINYRVMGKPFAGAWTFNHHPWLKGIHDCEAESIIGQKSAQMGYTEVALNKVFKAVDIEGISVLYVLPASTPDASDFSSARFDPALDLSDHLSGLFTDVRNVGHKRAGSASLYIRGSRSRSQLKSIPVGLVIVDEKDEMVQENVAMIFERMSGHEFKNNFQISTPTIDNFGINIDFRISTQASWFFKCPCCSRRTHLVFPDCIVLGTEDITDQKLKDTYMICKECKGTLHHEDKVNFLGLDNADWVKSYTDRDIEGFHINQLYSMTVKPWEIAHLYLRARSNPADEQEFFNSKLGLPHVVEGARVLDADIESCTGTFTKVARAPENSLITMGVDVGTYLHYEIDQWYLDESALGSDVSLLAKPKILQEGKIVDFENLDELMHRYLVHFCVIDANPERRKALEFAQRFWGRVKMCYYGNNIGHSKQIHLHDEDEHSLTVDRTSWLDVSLSRFRTNRIILPVDLSIEYRQQIKAPVRVYEKDKNNNPIGRYITGNEEDHYAHSRNYAEIALPLAANLSMAYDLGKIL
jgi:hypothetical protein